MASDDRHEDQAEPQAPPLTPADPRPPSVALLPEPFTVNAEAVGLAAAAARAALRRTNGLLGRFSRLPQPPLQDPSRAVAEPLELP